MLKNSLSLMATCFAVIFLQSCGEYKKNENGLRYKIIVDSAGPTGEIGGMAMVNYEIRNSKDSLMQSTFKAGGPVQMGIQKPPFKGGLEEGFLLLSQGDSAAFLISSDSIFTKNKVPAPKGIAPKSDLKFIIKIVKLLNKEDVKKEEVKIQKQRKQEQKDVYKQLESDTLAILNFLKEKGIKASKTQNGVYVVINTPGNGRKVERGDSVQVNYVGKLLNGKEFDSGKGFPVVVGVSQVIYGWHEGLTNLNHGDKATLYIPSPLGYGKQGGGSIPPDAILIFDVELGKPAK